MKSVRKFFPDIHQPLREDQLPHGRGWYELGASLVIEIIECIEDELKGL